MSSEANNNTLQFGDCALRMHADDSVAVVKRPLKQGKFVVDGELRWTINQTIPPGHKFALCDIEDGAPILKYGQTVGFAARKIAAGDHVHTHNVELGSFGRDYAFGESVEELELYGADKQQTFNGYLRTDGRVGTRNYVAVISSVNCSSSVSKYVAEAFANDEFRERFPNVDGVIAFKHTSGCANDPGEPTDVLQRVMAGIARHPNVGGYLLIGLGCEVNQVQSVIRNQGLGRQSSDDEPIAMEIQSLGGIRKTIAAAVEAVENMLPRVNAAERTPRSISHLALAMNCGGSDGNSGITANPALGFASDELVRHGASTVLAETTEIYGAEHLLTRRAVTREVGEKLIEYVKWWEDYAEQHGVSINNNPSTGNKAGGLTTIYEKSLGAVAKGGRAPLKAVYRYADQIDTPGFCFMDTPGFDPISMTGLVSGGCNVGVFTTGRGSVYGCKPTPCIKVATNTPLYNWMEDDMDINAGTILDGTETVDEVGRRIFEKIVSVANGERTKSELAGVGDEEFAPWILGSVL